MKKIILLLLIFAINLLQAQVPQSERDALIALYNATDGPNWTYTDNWNTNNPVNTWTGVTVENINGQDHVTQIELKRKNLTGTIPAEIGNFPYLTKLNIGNNHLSGTIPTEIGNLTNLTYLRLSFNNLSGAIPTEISNLTNLSYLSLAFNDLSGTIPANFSSFTSLEYLFFSGNNLSGTIPDLSSNTNLLYFYIYQNDFQFADLEPHFNDINNLIQANNGYFIYTPMNKLDTELSIDMVNGNNYTLNMPTVSGTGVTYQWYHNDIAISGATSQTYTINNTQDSDLGDYTCKAGSPVIPDLTIDRNVIHLYGTILQSDKDALLALYNATDGPNWTNHDNWDTTEKVYNWYGIKMRGNRVIEIDLQNNNLNGTIPSNIGDLTELLKLNLSYNGSNYYPGDLHGSIPPEIGNLTSLEYLWIDFANLSGNIPPEIGNLSNLKDLALWYNQLTGSIPPEIGNLSNLETLTVEDNPLTGAIPASLANLTKMRSFWIGNNQLTGDIPAGLFDNMPDLYYTAIYGNDLTGDVDLSHNLGLRGVWMYEMQISSIDMRNGQNDKIWYFYTYSNPNLSCIYVDDKNASYLSNWNIDPNSHFVESQAECDALTQTTYVPDDNFENYLETHDAQGNTVPVGDANSMGNGIANDDYVFTSRISNVTSLDVHQQNISDLTGIEGFQNLQSLSCYLNQLTNLDVSQNTDLQSLDCQSNQLTGLDVTQNTSLLYLNCDSNQITNLDVSQNTDLLTLGCGNNYLTSLDVTQNSALLNLYCHVNQLTTLNTSQNPALTTLICAYNQLTIVDVTQNPNLSKLWVFNNNLSSLNVQNGHNTQLTGTSYGQQRFRATGNPDLICIFVDDANYSTNNWIEIDPQSHFVETQAECDALHIDESFKESIQVYPNPFTDKIDIKVADAANIKTIRIQNMQGQIIYKGDFMPQISLPNLQRGMYLLNITDKQGNQAVFKLMKD